MILYLSSELSILYFIIILRNKMIKIIQSNHLQSQKIGNAIKCPCNIIIMKNFINKKKAKVQNQGNSEFTRAKLQSQYNPKYRVAKHQLMSFQKIPLQDRHEYRSKQENQICQKAVEQIKNGSNLVIDWNTRTNFRTTKSILPRLKTEPTDYDKFSLPYQGQTSNSLTPIQQKRIQLAKLLHIRHKKHYLQTKREQQEEKALFGVHNNSHANKTGDIISPYQTHRKNTDKFMFSRKRNNNTEEKIQKVQSEIIKESKLQLLKQELKSKFVQIREFLYRSQTKVKPKKKGFFE